MKKPRLMTEIKTSMRRMQRCMPRVKTAVMKRTTKRSLMQVTPSGRMSMIRRTMSASTQILTTMMTELVMKRMRMTKKRKRRAKGSIPRAIRNQKDMVKSLTAASPPQWRKRETLKAFITLGKEEAVRCSRTEKKNRPTMIMMRDPFTKTKTF